MNRAFLLLAICSFLFLRSDTVNAEAMTFDFTDPKGINSATFALDSPLEPIMGYIGGVSGEATYDPEAKSLSAARIRFDIQAISFPNERMTSVALSEDWLEAETYPEAVFEMTEAGPASYGKDGSTNFDVTGTFTLHGIEREVTIPVSVTYLPEGVEKRMSGKTGDLVVVRSQFVIDRTEFGITKGANGLKVGHDIEITTALVGAMYVE